MNRRRLFQLAVGLPALPSVLKAAPAQAPAYDMVLSGPSSGIFAVGRSILIRGGVDVVGPVFMRDCRVVCEGADLRKRPAISIGAGRAEITGCTFSVKDSES